MDNSDDHILAAQPRMVSLPDESRPKRLAIKPPERLFRRITQFARENFHDPGRIRSVTRVWNFRQFPSRQFRHDIDARRKISPERRKSWSETLEGEAQRLAARRIRSAVADKSELPDPLCQITPGLTISRNGGHHLSFGPLVSGQASRGPG